MTYTSILVALGLGHRRDTAFERALAMARASGAELHLLHAVPPDRPYSFRGVERLARSGALRARAEAAGVTVHEVRQHGDVADLIVLHANARAVDLIVMGTEQRTGWARFWQPSIAERVLRLTQRPTLVVPDGDADYAAAPTSVVAAVDLTSSAAPVIASALQWAGDDPRRLTVVHAVDSLEAADAVWSRARWVVPEYRGHVLARARREVHALLPAGGATGERPRVRVSGGSPSRAIAEAVAATDASLVVMGASARRWHLGSTAARVLRRGDRAVLILPRLPAEFAHTHSSRHRRAA